MAFFGQEFNGLIHANFYFACYRMHILNFWNTIKEHNRNIVFFQCLKM